MKKKWVSSLCVLSVGAVLAGLISVIVAALEPSDLSSVAHSLKRKSWYPLIHVSWNTFHLWRLDPVLSRITSILTGDEQFVGMTSRGLHFFVFFAGLYLLQRSRGVSSQNAGFFGILILVTILGTFGLDSVVLGSLTWFPLLLWAISEAPLQSRKGIFALLTFGLASRVALTANQLSPIWGLFALILASRMNDSQEERTVIATAYRRFLILLVLTPTLYVAFTTPSAVFPDYPAFSHVVPNDGVPGLNRPLIGPDMPLEIIDRGALRSDLLPLASILFGLGTLLFVRAKNGKLFFSLPTLLAGLVTLDVLLPESLSQLAPIAAFCRLYPGASFLPLDGALLGLTLALLFLGISIYVKRSCIIGSSCSALLMIGSMGGPLFRTELPYPLKDPLFLGAHAKFVSPSLHLIKEIGIESFERFEDSKGLVSITPKWEELTVVASHRNLPLKLHRLFDGVGSSRWSPKIGRQTGTESLRIFFHTPKNLGGIELLSGDFGTDFPRGIEIRGASHCPPGGPFTDSDYSLLYRANPWNGPLGVTPNGYPYLGWEGYVRILFNENLPLSCLLIKQIGETESFDWSIAELRLLEAH